MKTKNIIRINESQLRKIVGESVKRVLKEVRYNGRSYRGDSPGDWDELQNLRYDKADSAFLNRDMNSFYKNVHAGYKNGENVIPTLEKLFDEARKIDIGEDDGRLEKAENYYEMIKDGTIKKGTMQYSGMIRAIEMFLRDLINNPTLDDDYDGDDYYDEYDDNEEINESRSKTLKKSSKNRFFDPDMERH